MFDVERPYAIHWELTDLCNLKCPMCPRTDHHNYCRPVAAVGHRQFFLEDVEKYLPDHFLKRVKAVDFCGNYGDPCVARDFLKICRYLIQRYDIALTVSTNGSMRQPDWWRQLGDLFAPTPGLLEFHIDGLEDTNHLYRIGADWTKIMDNAAAYISAGGKADWLFIAFKHNQHQIHQACDTARKMGFYRFVQVDTGRFPDDHTFPYQHPDGGIRHLEQATVSGHHESAYAAGAHREVEAEKFSTNKKSIIPAAISGIRCKSSKHNRFYLDASGNLAPCCWVAGVDDRNSGNMLKAVKAAGRNPEDFNIRNRSIDDIVRDLLFSNIFPKLWTSDSLETCRKKCGRQHRNIRKKMLL
jgi:sulfatase maturation enzyme AslB (radical SAM superfamily)